jgi:hypothetical protein
MSLFKFIFIDDVLLLIKSLPFAGCSILSTILLLLPLFYFISVPLFKFYISFSIVFYLLMDFDDFWLLFHWL